MAESRALAEQYRRLAERLGTPPRPFCFLVARGERRRAARRALPLPPYVERLLAVQGDARAVHPRAWGNEGARVPDGGLPRGGRGGARIRRRQGVMRLVRGDPGLL